MKKIITAALLLIASYASGQHNDLAFVDASTTFSDTSFSSNGRRAFSSQVINFQFASFNLKTLLENKIAARRIAGYSKKGRPIYLYYFPGTTDKNALVIGGVHGSELSSIEVVNNLVEKLTGTSRPYYNVILVPSLFPDNANTAGACKKDRIANNKGRYSTDGAVDPNRQMPELGKPFYNDAPVDAHRREIEKENTVLLQLIQAFAPQRIVTVHAIRDAKNCGVFADPRTDCNGLALGFESDSALVMLMAKHIVSSGGIAAGNNLLKSPASRYYLDPPIAKQGTVQKRNLKGSGLPNGLGVSLGSWASTEVCDEESGYNRGAIRLITMEFPGYKRASEYKTTGEQQWYEKQVAAYASSIYTYFLQPFLVEQTRAFENILALK
jgi:hypothetical protein